MGQSDSATDAGLAQLNFEEISKIPGGEFVEIISDLMALTGIAGPLAAAGAASSLLLKIRGLAGASYASNLIFAITAVSEDLKTLRESHAGLRERFDALSTDPRFAEAVSALALRAMHTSVKDRLRRLARIVVNGVKEDDLEPESLDDMMRAAVELRETDIVLLGSVYRWQNQILSEKGMNPDKWFGDIQRAHTQLVESGVLNPAEHLRYRSSYSRLESAGLVQAMPAITNTYGVGYELYALLIDGKKFYERLQEIGSTK